MDAVQVKRFARFLRKRSNRPDFSAVVDPRARRGRRWSLTALLNAVFIGMMAMETSLRGVERLTRDLEGCRRSFGVKRRVPDSTLARLLARHRDEDGLRNALIGQVRAAERRKALAPVRLPINMVMLDGQTLWCSKTPIDDPACQKMEQPDGRVYYPQILAVVRSMWGVENGCHWTLDVVLEQDTRCWCTSGRAQRMLSWVRLMAYNALRLLKERYLRSERSRSMPWDEVRRLMQRVLTDGRAWLSAATPGSSVDERQATI